ncbi:MAG: hypothetical protein WA191_07025 [Telluria sp.]
MNKEVEYNPSGLLDAVIAKHGLKNDAALSRLLKITPSLISKVRNKKIPVGPSMILAIHENFGLPASVIRRYIGSVV